MFGSQALSGEHGAIADQKHPAIDLLIGAFFSVDSSGALLFSWRGCDDYAMTFDGHLEVGQAALQSGRWQDAVSAFEASLAERETPEAMEGLGEAYWWLGRANSSIRCREDAFIGYRKVGDAIRACRVAVDLSISYLVNLGNAAAARGWLARAERIMGEADPNPMQGWLLLMGGFLSKDRGHAQELLAGALSFARSSQDVDLELVALSDLGIALVSAGKVDEGLAMLDEAMAGTLAGEYRRLDTVVYTSCNMLAACSLAGDLVRATEWCRVADDFMNTYGSPFMYATCRAHFGGVLVEKGQWGRAEDELKAALEMSEDASPAARSEALANLADLRLRQGRLEEADVLLESAPDTVTAALPAAALRLARGEPEVAIALLLRRLKRLGERHIQAAQTLRMLVDAHLATGDLEQAFETASRLEALAHMQDLPHVSALSSLASAHLAAARGSTEEAVAHLEDALHQFSQLDIPLETGRVRLELALALAESLPEVATVEARIALAAFDQLGATADADEAASLLRSFGVTGRTGPKGADVLTKREQEVLHLVAQGMSNPEIAERLFISRKTAAHHVSSILTKLGLRNRAEAAAYEARVSASTKTELKANKPERGSPKGL